MQPRWLDWAQRLQAIAQAGLSYEPHMFDRERYAKIQEIAEEIVSGHTELEAEVLHEIYEEQAGHPTPKIGVRGAVFHQNGILLVREKMDGGRWTLPGGWIDVNESPAEAAVREVFEESGYRTKPVKMLALYDHNFHMQRPKLFHAYTVVIQCELLNRNPVLEHDGSAAFLETDDATFFREDQIPSDLSIARITRGQITRFFEHYRRPHLPADFD